MSQVLKSKQQPYLPNSGFNHFSPQKKQINGKLSAMLAQLGCGTILPTDGILTSLIPAEAKNGSEHEAPVMLFYRWFRSETSFLFLLLKKKGKQKRKTKKERRQ